GVADTGRTADATPSERDLGNQSDNRSRCVVEWLLLVAADTRFALAADRTWRCLGDIRGVPGASSAAARDVMSDIDAKSTGQQSMVNACCLTSTVIPADGPP